MKAYRNAERTKKWIRRAFTELMAEKRDIDKITVTELARRADISKTTFYYHYSDIYAVAEEFENELLCQLSDFLAGLTKAAKTDRLDFEYYTRGIISFLKSNEQSYRMVISADSPRLFVEKLKRNVANKIAESASFLPFASDPDKWQVRVCFIVGACVDVVVEYFKGGLSVPFDTVTEVILDAVSKLTVGLPCAGTPHTS